MNIVTLVFGDLRQINRYLLFSNVYSPWGQWRDVVGVYILWFAALGNGRIRRCALYRPCPSGDGWQGTCTSYDPHWVGIYMYFAITSRERDHCLCCWINTSCVVLYTFLKICISLILSSFYISDKACKWFCCANVYHCWYPLSSCMHLIVVSYLSSSPDVQVLPYLSYTQQVLTFALVPLNLAANDKAIWYLTCTLYVCPSLTNLFPSIGYHFL